VALDHLQPPFFLAVYIPKKEAACAASLLGLHASFELQAESRCHAMTRSASPKSMRLACCSSLDQGHGCIEQRAGAAYGDWSIRSCGVIDVCEGPLGDDNMHSPVACAAPLLFSRHPVSMQHALQGGNHCHHGQQLAKL